jgi:hypothetical protein
MGLRRKVDTVYALVVLVEAVLLAALGVLELILPPARGVPLMILGLSFLMGLQNAIVTISPMRGCARRTCPACPLISASASRGWLPSRGVTCPTRRDRR